MLKFGIQHPYALFNETNTLIHIDNAQKATNHKFYCPDCLNPFIPCQGFSNRWYFRHLTDEHDKTCTNKIITSDRLNYFDRYPKIVEFINTLKNAYPHLTQYKIINKTLFALVNESSKNIIEIIDFRGIKHLETRIETAKSAGYDILLVSLHHAPIKKPIESRTNSFPSFHVLEFQTQLFPELFVSMKEHSGIITFDEKNSFIGWEQSNNPKYQTQVKQIVIKSFIEEIFKNASI